MPDLYIPDKDLLYVQSRVGIKVSVHDVVYDLIGEISTDSESDQEGIDSQLEQFLITNSFDSDSQVMARTKQTGQKEQVKKVSAGGLPLALSNSSS